jgi:hypothetical protein
LKAKSLIILISIFFVIVLSQQALGAVPTGGEAYYDFNTGSGSTLFDQWNSNDGTINGMSWSSTVPSYNINGDGSPYSGSFDGVNDYVSIPDSDSLSFTDETVSFSMWISSTSSSGSCFLSKAVGDNDREYFFQYGSSSTKVRFYNNGDKDTYDELSYNFNFDNGDWYHYVVTGDGSNWKLYIDGSLVDTTSTTVSMGNYNPNVNIGRFGSDVLYFDGKIDDFKIFSKALNTTEVQNLYNYNDINGFSADTSNITFISQKPSDLDILNGFDDNLHISYNYTNVSNQTGFAYSGFNGSTNDNWPTDITFFENSFYVLGEDGDEVNIYDSLLNLQNTKSVSQDAFGEAIERKGDYWYLLGDNSKKVYRYDNTFSYNSVNYDINFDFIPSGTGAYYYDMLWNGTNWLLLSEGSPTNASISNYVYVLNESFNYKGKNYSITSSNNNGFDYNNGTYYFISQASNKIFLYNESFDYQSEFYDLEDSKAWYALHVEDERLLTVDRTNDEIREYITQPILKYRVNSTELDCVSYVNGSCDIFVNTTYINTPSSNNSIDVFNYTIFADNDLYPGTYNLAESEFIGYTPITFVANSKGEGILIEHENLSLDAEVQFLEFYANQTTTGTSDIKVYYCNSTYSTGKTSTSNSCTLLEEFTGSSNYSHCHSNSSCHYLVPIFTDDSDKVNGEVQLTELSYFPIIRTTGSGDWSFYYKNTVVREGAGKTTNNEGLSYSNLVGTFDSHVHYFSGNETLYYQAFGTVDGNFSSSSERSDDLELAAVIPPSVTIYSPLEGDTVNAYLFINYSNVSFYSDSGYYNISLLNNDTTFNRTIIGNNGLSTTYNWSIYKENLTLDDYRILIEAVDDVNDLSSISRSGSWTLDSNSLLNITAYEIVSNDTISNFTGWLYNSDTLENVTFTADGTNALVPIIRNNSYQVFISKDGNYSGVTESFTALDNDTTNLNLGLYIWNSVYIQFKDADTLELIDDRTVYLDLISDTFSNNYSTSNGTLYVTLLQPETYIARYDTDNYSERFNTFTLINGSSLNKTFYFQNNSVNVTIGVFDETRNFLAGVTVISQKFNVETNSYITQEVTETDAEGLTVQKLTQGDEFYKFFVRDSDGDILPVIISGDTRTSTPPAYIYSSTVSIQVQTGAVGDNYTDVYEGFEVITFELNNATNNIKVEYSDQYSLAEQVCLTTYTQSASGRRQYARDCEVSSNVGTILQSIIDPNQTTYYSKVTVIRASDQEEVFITDQLFQPEGFDYGVSGMVLQLLLTTTMIGVSAFSLPLSVIFIPLSLFFGYALSWHNLGLASYSIITIVGVIVAFSISRYRR